MVTVAIVWASKVGLQIGPPLRVGQDGASAWEQYGYIYIYIMIYKYMLYYVLDGIFIRKHMYKTYMSTHMRHELYHCIVVY